MSALIIEVQGGKTAFAPGEELRGRVAWEFEKPEKWLEIRLFRFTRGKGTKDVEAIDKLRFDEEVPPSGEENFRFTLPGGPYSFSGKLISLVWALELVSKRNGSERLEFTLSPTGEEIDIR